MMQRQQPAPERLQDKMMVVDFRREKQRSHPTPLRIYGILVKRVDRYRYLIMHISEDLTWTTHISTLVQKARQHLYHLRQLRKLKISTALQRFSYTTTIESLFTESIITW